MTIREATEKWVGRFHHIPKRVIEKLDECNGDETMEITPLTIWSVVQVCGTKYDGLRGQVIRIIEDGDIRKCEVQLDDSHYAEPLILEDLFFEPESDEFLPIWGTMWAFRESFDNDWLTDPENLQAMADCGFRIYEQEDYGYIFGIDGAGYDFYEKHWIPLYKARGLQWHDEKEDNE